MIRAHVLGLGACVVFLACSSASKTTGGASAGCADLVTAENEAEVRCNRHGRSSAGYARAVTRCQNDLNAPGNGITTGALDACTAQLRASCDLQGGACAALDDVVGTQVSHRIWRQTT